jgi:galactokinase
MSDSNARDAATDAAQRCKESLRRRRRTGELHALFSPYRICPIGAHIDHQGGTVLGQAIDAGTTMAFAPREDGEIRLTSENYPGEARTAAQRTEPPALGWGKYTWAAARALEDLLPPGSRGLDGTVAGALPGGGLSSSSSFLLAVQTALLQVNGIELEKRERVHRAWRAETEFVGLQCGILDQASIVGARRGYLLAIDAAAGTWEPVAPGHSEADARFLVCFSGAARNLMTTGFNERVAQCRNAAARLAELAHAPPSQRLGDHDDSVFEEYGNRLPDQLRRRAEHFFGERRRVAAGIRAWREGDLPSFGQAMRESCRSSIENFEVGSPELLELQKILNESEGVLGSRFSGAGFAGCVLALVRGSGAEECRTRVAAAYARAVPALTDAARFFLVTSSDGMRLL